MVNPFIAFTNNASITFRAAACGRKAEISARPNQRLSNAGATHKGLSTMVGHNTDVTALPRVNAEEVNTLPKQRLFGRVYMKGDTDGKNKFMAYVRKSSRPPINRRRHPNLTLHDSSITAEVKKRIEENSLDKVFKFTFDGKDLWELRLDQISSFFHDLSADHKVQAFEMLADEPTRLAVENADLLGKDVVADQWEQCKAKVYKVFGIQYAILEDSLKVYTLSDLFRHLQAIGHVSPDRIVEETVTCGAIIQALVNAGIVLPKTAFTALLVIYNDEQLQHELCLASMEFGIDTRWDYVGEPVFWGRMRYVAEEFTKLNFFERESDYLVEKMLSGELGLNYDILSMLQKLEQWRKGNDVEAISQFVHAASLASCVSHPEILLSRYVPLSIRKRSFHFYDNDEVDDPELKILETLHWYVGNRAETARIVKKLRQLAPNDAFLKRTLPILDDYFDNYGRNTDLDRSGARRVAHAISRIIEHSEGETRMSKSAINSSLFHLIYYKLPNPVDGWYLAAIDDQGTPPYPGGETGWALGLAQPLHIFVKVMESWVDKEPLEAIRELHRQLKTPTYFQRHRHACFRCGSIHNASKDCPDEKDGITSTKLDRAFNSMYKREAGSRERVIPAVVKKNALWNMDIRNNGLVNPPGKPS